MLVGGIGNERHIFLKACALQSHARSSEEKLSPNRNQCAREGSNKRRLHIHAELEQKKGCTLMSIIPAAQIVVQSCSKVGFTQNIPRLHNVSCVCVPPDHPESVTDDPPVPSVPPNHPESFTDDTCCFTRGFLSFGWKVSG